MKEYLPKHMLASKFMDSMHTICAAVPIIIQFVLHDNCIEHQLGNLSGEIRIGNTKKRTHETSDLSDQDRIEMSYYSRASIWEKVGDVMGDDKIS